MTASSAAATSFEECDGDDDEDGGPYAQEGSHEDDKAI